MNPALIDLDNSIRLRWVLRDIEGKRLKWSPPDPNDLRILIEMGFVQIVQEMPTLTGTGLVENGFG